MYDRAIIHLDLDSFFVSCERLINPKLIGKPVLVGGTSDRGVVASCSYEARTYGIHSAMPMRMAKNLCPEAIVVKGNSGTYSQYSSMVTEIIKESSPLYEKTSIDEFYVDASGMDHFFGCYKWATELREKIIRETNLPISFGLSPNKTVSKVGTGEAKPNGYIEIQQGTERQFLSPLSIKKIPMVGGKTFELLKRMGVEYIHTVQEMDMKIMQRVLGVNGVAIWKKCQGIDTSPVIPYHERKSISTERTFERDTIDVQKLKQLVIGMAENLAYQLRRGEKLTACATVKIRYADMSTYSKQRRLSYTASDKVLIDACKTLFDSLYDRRQRIRLVGVRFSHLVGGGHQMNLFEGPTQGQLYHAMDAIRTKFGQDAVKRAVCMHAHSLARVNPFNGEPPVILAHRRA